MTTSFFIAWACVLATGGILIPLLEWAVTSKQYSEYRIRTPKNYRLPALQKALNTNLNMLLSLLIYIAFLIYFGDTVIYAGWPGMVLLLGEVLAVLLLYDFMYYLFHRGMHHPKVMQYVHYLHHKVRYTTATESTFIHPLENIGGVALLCLSLWIVGPISGASFVVMFFIYQTANIMVHSNLVIPHPSWRLFGFWAEKHDIHHTRINYNFASIFPFWDQAFGTYK